jgi:integrase
MTTAVARAPGAGSQRGLPFAAVGVTVLTATGEHTLQAPRVTRDALDMPACGFPERLRPLLDTADLLLGTIGESGAAKINGACGRFEKALRWWGMLRGAVTAAVICAFVILRCAPPVGHDRPSGFDKPVLPSTAIGDVDALRRAARLGLNGMAELLQALDHSVVHQLSRAIGARVKRLKTSKRPLLFHEVKAYVDKALLSDNPTLIRNAFALAVAFFFAMRVSELLALNDADMKVIDGVAGAPDVITIRFRQVKNRSTVFATHDPFEVSSSHPLLLQIFDVYDKKLGFLTDVPLFHRLTGSTRDRLERGWFARVVATAAPGCVPHSCRVGAATEMHAAGVPLRQIMAVGRWMSTAALLYVLGNEEDQVHAIDSIGSAGLAYAGGRLHKAASADVAAWARVVVAAQAREAELLD